MLHNDPVYFLLKGPSLPPASEADAILGRIVRNYAQPLSDYAPDDASVFNARPINTTPLSNVARIVNASKNSALEGKIMAFAKAVGESDKDVQSSLLSSEIHAKELQKQGDVFQALLSNEEIRQKMVKWTHPGSNPVYMVVGLLIWQDARLMHNLSKKQGHDIGTTLPVGAAGSAAIAAYTGENLPSEAMGDLSLKKRGETKLSAEQSAESKENQIFAIQCRIVRRRRRNIFMRSAPALEDFGPRVEGERSYAGVSSESAAKSEHDSEEVANAILELDPEDVPWMDSLEDLEAQPALEVVTVDAANRSFGLAYEQSMEFDM